jgi:hypothetical protein
MATTTSTMLDQITVEKTQIREGLAWLDADRERRRGSKSLHRRARP